jgi:phosphate transport system permease protein
MSTKRSAAARHVADRLAGWVIRAGGATVMLSLLAIFIFLIVEVTPLFQEPSATWVRQFHIPETPSFGRVLHVGMDEHREVGFVLGSAGLAFFDLNSGQRIPADVPEALRDKPIAVVAKAGANSTRFALGTVDGWIIPVKIAIRTDFSESGIRSKRPVVSLGQPIQASQQAIVALAYRVGDVDSVVAATTADGQLVVRRFREDQEASGSAVVALTSPPIPMTAVALDASSQHLFVGTVQGLLYYYDLADPDQPSSVAAGPSEGPSKGVATMGFLTGDRTLVVTTTGGTVSTWGLVRDSRKEGRWQLHLTHRLDSHPTAVTSFSPSQRDRSFLTADADGTVALHYATTARTLLHIKNASSPLVSIALAPKGNGLMMYDQSGLVTLYDLHNPHPEVSWRTLFGKVWYEGYDEPAYVWQSSSGSDEFESKFSLIPLGFGTLKGTLYALFLAIPIAIGAAVFTSQFMSPAIRAMIKPAIEMMAALPTVVLGFIAGLWLAPSLERWFPALLGAVFLLPISVLGVAWCWSFFPQSWRRRVRPGTEAFLLLPVLIAAMALCLFANPLIEQLAFGGDFRAWLSTQWGVTYDQRNAVVVGLMMGFAVIPIVYSIAEEALANVPRHLIAGSLALGATRWQTVRYLVLLAASPGIFSAVMIGFGRAIGETMIVLMATGNTPLMDWSWANGFRTLSATIAVEIPEAPQGGTLYRVLFLAALLLFVVTFVINTVADLVRQRLREKYAHR